jgi:DNA-binding XRE family transcriptional regulator
MGANPIRMIREARGLSVSDFAKLVGVSATCVRDLETGRVVSLSPQWAGAVEMLGADWLKTCEAYRAWRVSEQAAIAARFEPQA